MARLKILKPACSGRLSTSRPWSAQDALCNLGQWRSSVQHHFYPRERLPGSGLWRNRPRCSFSNRSQRLDRSDAIHRPGQTRSLGRLRAGFQHRTRPWISDRAFRWSRGRYRVVRVRWQQVGRPSRWTCRCWGEVIVKLFYSMGTIRRDKRWSGGDLGQVAHL